MPGDHRGGSILLFYRLLASYIHYAKIHGIRVVFISVTVSTFGRVK